MGGGHLASADVVVLLALGGWVAQRLLGMDTRPAPGRVHSPVLGWPLALFAVAILSAGVRGHFYYGQSLFGEPTRLVLYAAVALALTQVTAAQAYRIVVAVFYVGTVWMMLTAVYYIATGTSQTGSVGLSTGGTRVLSISVSMYMAAALFLALLNLRHADTAMQRSLHAAIACLAAVGVVLGYGRAVFAGAAVGIALVFLSREIRRAALLIVPLLVPVLAIAAIVATRAAPNVVPAFMDRITASPTRDANVIWRERVNAAVWEQVRESPLTGVGFGRGVSFTMPDLSSSGLVFSRVEHQSQDPHNSFMYLLAGGGIVALASFLLLCATFLWDAWRRWRTAVAFEERTIIVWTALTLFVFFFNTLSSPTFGNTSELLTIWTLLVLPSVVPLRRPEPAAQAHRLAAASLRRKRTGPQLRVATRARGDRIAVPAPRRQPDSSLR